jgi:hypothetical protein
MIGPLLVAIDKFTKWIEVKPVTCPKADRVLDFLDELVHRYELPHRIIADLGSNFNNYQFWEYCENGGIDIRYVSVTHPRANGQVECANGMVLDALKNQRAEATCCQLSCRSTPDFSNGRATQVRPANLLDGLKQRSRVRSSATRAPPHSFTGHQATTCRRRLAVAINQVNKSWDRNKENMVACYLEVCKLENKFYGLEFHHVVRDNNVAADVLSKLSSTRAQVPAGVFVHELHALSIPEPTPTTTDLAHLPAGQEVMMIDVDWRQPFIDYIREQKIPADKSLAEQLIRWAKSYVLVGDKLYKRGATSEVLMKCVP